MAKGRKLITSRSERLLGSYGYGDSQGSPGGDPDLGEDDIWSMVDDASARDDHSPRNHADSFSNGVVRSRRVVHSHHHHHHHHQEERHVGGLSLAFDDSAGRTASSRILHQFRGNDISSSSPRGAGAHHMASSAPVNVPDWSKILRVDSVESLHEFDGYGEYYGGGGGGVDESEIVPPHVYLAREYAHSRKTAANSVFEGVGRTLKGRDLSRVRDAVWRQTGFDG